MAVSLLTTTVILNNMGYHSPLQWAPGMGLMVGYLRRWHLLSVYFPPMLGHLRCWYLQQLTPDQGLFAVGQEYNSRDVQVR